MIHRALVVLPKPLFVIWDDMFGLQCIERSSVVKRLNRPLWNTANRYRDFSFGMGLEKEIVQPHGSMLNLNSFGLYQIMLHHAFKVSKTCCFEPQKHLKHYFDVSQSSHNHAWNWFDYVFPHLLGNTPLTDIDGSLVSYSVRVERELRGEIWAAV